MHTNTAALKAYHGNPHLKQMVVADMAAHREADQLAQGYGYWKDGKGCAVGCLIQSGNYAEYETRFGIPQMLAQLEDCIFEGLPPEEAQAWPERFLGSIKVGSDLSLVGWKFLHWLLTQELTLKDCEDAAAQVVIVECRVAITQCVAVVAKLAEGEMVNARTSVAAQAAEVAWAAAEAAAQTAWAARAETDKVIHNASRAAWTASRVEAAAAWTVEADSAAQAAQDAQDAVEAAQEVAAQKPAYWLRVADQLIAFLQAA